MDRGFGGRKSSQLKVQLSVNKHQLSICTHRSPVHLKIGVAITDQFS